MNLKINISNTKLSEISCYESGACDNIKIITDNDNTMVKIYQHSQNITINTPSGYHYNNLECGDVNAYFTLTNEFPTINQSISNTIYDPLPSQGIIYVTNETASCQIKHGILDVNVPFHDYSMSYGPLYFNDTVTTECIAIVAIESVMASVQSSNAANLHRHSRRLLVQEPAVNLSWRNGTTDSIRNLKTAAIAVSKDETSIFMLGGIVQDSGLTEFIVENHTFVDHGQYGIPNLGKISCFANCGSQIGDILYSRTTGGVLGDYMIKFDTRNLSIEYPWNNNGADVFNPTSSNAFGCETSYTDPNTGDSYLFYIEMCVLEKQTKMSTMF